MVGQTNDGFIFYECKYTNIKINDEMIKEEISQISKTNLNPVNYGFFSKRDYDIKEKIIISCILLMIYLNNVNNKKAPHNEELIFLVAFPRGFEPPAFPLGGERSIQLSYRNMQINNSTFKFKNKE